MTRIYAVRHSNGGTLNKNAAVMQFDHPYDILSYNSVENTISINADGMIISIPINELKYYKESGDSYKVVDVKEVKSNVVDEAQNQPQ